MNFTDRIKPTDKGITTYLDELKNQNYQIPTFQRDVVWEEENVKKLWDSIYKFYPLGSILVWKTDLKLQNHRQIGGHKIADEHFTRSEYQYLLDGQQRTTSLLTSLYGGQIEGRDGFNPSLYIDLTIESEDETDDESYKKRFLYWNEIDDRDGAFKRNIGRKKKYDDGLIVKLLDVKQNFETIQQKIVNHPDVAQQYNHPYWVELRKVQQVLSNYRISFIELKGIKVAEVCQIFERINQAGKPLDIFDIVVAKTFRPKSETDKGFYLRDLIDDFKKVNNSNYLQIDDFDYLQIIAILIRENIENSGIHNITPRYLNDIKTEQIESIWDSAKKAILKTFDFFENTLNLKGPQLIPYRYFYLTIANYFYKNDTPNYDFLKKYFWFNSLHRDDLLSNTGDINQHISLLNGEKYDKEQRFGRFLIDKDTLRKSSYSSKGRISRAILSLYSHKCPKDWKYTDRNVNVDNFFFSTDKPNLHHIFPTNYISNNRADNQLDNNSLMNIAYLTQLTNLEISDKNPLEYIKEYDENPNFESVIDSHLLPKQILTWARMDEMPSNALDQFMEERVELVIEELKRQLSGINIEVIDTKEKETIEENENVG
jgi:hypothetical protein